MTYLTATLNNGLRVIHLPSPSQVVYCGFQIHAGTRHERPEEQGLAHFVEHMTFKGTSRRKALQVANSLETVGGDLNAFTTKEDTTYYAALLKDHLPKAIDVLTDIVFHSVYPQREVEKEVAVVREEIESYHDSPSELIYDEFENAVFEHHPLGHNILGDVSHLSTYTSADAQRFARNFYRPENAVFFSYGDVDFPRLLRLLEKATPAASGGPIVPLVDSDGPTAAPRQATADALPPYHPRHIEIAKGTHQAHIMLGNRAYSVHHPCRMALYLLNNMLGGPSMTARLHLLLRERYALVYSVESTMVSYSDTGIWSVYLGCDPHDVEQCLHLIRLELNRFMQKPLSERKLQAAKKQIKGQIGVACDNREQFALDFGKSYLHRGREKDLTALFADIDRVSAQQIQQVAQEIFAQDRITTLIYR